MNEPRVRPRIGFVSVIRPAFKGDGAAAARRSLDGLGGLADELGFELVDLGRPVTDAQEAERAAAELAERELDLLLVQHTTFATGDVVAPLLHAVKQVGVWGLPESAGGGGARGPLPLNSLCGLNMTLSLLDAPQVAKRERVKWFYGDVASPGFRRRLAPTVAALRGLRALATARVLAIGGTAPGFYGIEDVPALDGIEVVRRELDELFARTAAVEASQAEARAASWARREATDLTREQLVRGARIDVALETMARDAGADALAVRCWPELPDACGSMACAAMGESGAREVPAACEGDVMGALSMLALQGVSGAPALLMDLSDVDERDDSLLVWHCGNAPLAWASAAPDGARASRLTTHFNRDGVGVVRDMRLREGAVSGYRLLAGGRRAVVAGGRVRDPEKAAFDGVSGWIDALSWAETPVTAAGFVANILDRRVPHHLAFGSGDVVGALLELSAYLGAEVLPALPESAILRS